MIVQGLKIKGTIDITVTDEHGVAYTWTYRNIITSWGLAALAGVLAGTPLSPPVAYLAIGTGSVPASINDIALGTEAHRAAATVTHLTGNDANKVTFYNIWAEGTVTGVFTEAGLFDADSDGNMFNRRVFDQVTVGASNTLEITWTIEIDNA